jgi:hypothetical protein
MCAMLNDARKKLAAQHGKKSIYMTNVFITLIINDENFYIDWMELPKQQRKKICLIRFHACCQ